MDAGTGYAPGAICVTICPVGTGAAMSVGMLDEVEVGRPKKQEKPAEPMKPKTIGVRSSPEWAAWLERGAKHCRTDVAKLLDAAAVEYLAARGFKEPPPDRVP
jgi:hypothetical protein